MGKLQRNEAALGNCYETASQLFLASRLPARDINLCHGVVRQKGTGVRMGHGWVEERHAGQWFVRDGLYPTALIARPVYYKVGGVDAATVRRYDYRRAFAFLKLTDSYGPWDDVIKAAAHQGDLP